MAFLADGVVERLAASMDEPDLEGTKYRAVRLLGRGGMGAVWLAEDVELRREVALKVSTAVPDAETSERLRREAQVIARLEHPGIVPVHDLGTLGDGRLFYVMKRVRGERLDVWSEGRPLAERLRMFLRICEAVAFAHARGVVHRDLKPQNVMVGEYGEALVMDWGLAKELAVRRESPSGAGGGTRAPAPSEADTAAAIDDTLPAPAPPTIATSDRSAGGPGGATLPGTVLGTPSFMAPEQARGEVDRIDARSDVYALGAILYFLLAGRAPHDHGGGLPSDLLRRVVEESPPPLRRVAPGVARPLESICARAMARDPADRYGSAPEMEADIAAWLDGLPVSAHRERWLERGARVARRHRIVLLLLGAYLLMRLVVFVVARR